MPPKAKRTAPAFATRRGKFQRRKNKDKRKTPPPGAAPQEPSEAASVSQPISPLPRRQYETMDMELDEFLDEQDVREDVTSQRSRRLAIAVIFEYSHGGLPDSKTNPWNGRNGVIPKIRQALTLNERTDITHILEEVIRCKEFGIEYKGDRQIYSEYGLGRRPILATDSVEAQLAADTIEDGASESVSFKVWPGELGSSDKEDCIHVTLYLRNGHGRAHRSRVSKNLQRNDARARLVFLSRRIVTNDSERICRVDEI